MAHLNTKRINGTDYVYVISNRILTEKGNNAHYIGKKADYSQIQLKQIVERFNQMEQEHKSRVLLKDLRNNQTDVTISFEVVEIQEPLDRFKDGKKLKVANAVIKDAIESENEVYQLALWGPKEIAAVSPGKRYTLINGICKHYLSKTDGKLYVTLSKGKYGVLKNG